MDNACVIGYGVVGKATASVFGIEKHFDVIEEKSNMNLEDASKCKFVFICMPTPVDSEGNYEVKEIRQMIHQIEEYGGAPIYIIRSTVFPGFALHIQNEFKMARIISNPEFLTEATAEKDAKNPPFVILGGVAGGRYIKEVKALYLGRLKGSPIIVTDNTTAEMCKLTLNAFFATKVIFANQTYDACKTLGANYETVREVLEDHPFGSKNHFKVWFNGKRGVNGKCLPKDSKAFSMYGNSDLVKLVVSLNEKYIGLKEDEI
jgi:UDPglucose 6-dehydrogenase